MFENGSRDDDGAQSFGETNSGLHDDSYALPNRRPTHILNTPALIAHHVFWYSPKNADSPLSDRDAALWDRLSNTLKNAPETAPLSPKHNSDLQGEHEEDQPDPRLVIAQSLNEYLDILRSHSDEYALGSIPCFTSDPHLIGKSLSDTDGPDVQYVDYRTTLAFEGKVQGLPYECIIDIFPDHYTQSIRIYPNAIKADSDTPPPTLSATCKAAEILRDLVAGEQGTLEQKVRQKPKEGEDRFKEADKTGREWLETLYQEVWDEFFRNLQAECGAKDDLSPQALTARNPADFPSPCLPGSLVGVFKCLVIRPMAIEEQRACHDEHDDYGAVIHGDRSKVLRNVPAGVINHPNERNEIALSGFNAEPIDTARHLIKARLTQHLNHRSILFGLLLGYRSGTSWINDSQSGNAALSLMLDGLAIHGTTLGMHQKESSQTPFSEVRHFVIYGGPSRQQLGRLIRTLHAVGENRLLVLRSYTAIDLAGRRLQALRQDLAKAEGSLNKYSDTEDALSKAENALRVASRKLVELKEVQNDGGLTHRLSRLRTNEKNLLRQLEVLRIDRLEGWRPFDEFITRNVLPHVTYLKSVGFTLSVAEQDIQRLDSSILRHRGAIETSALVSTVDYIKNLQDKQNAQNNIVLGLAHIAASSGLLSVGISLTISFLNQFSEMLSFMSHNLTYTLPVLTFLLALLANGCGVFLLLKGLSLLFQNGSRLSPPKESQ